MSDSQCVAVPIEELLVAIPKDHRICIPFQWAEDGTETGHHFIPVGAHAHRAAATIADLRHQLAGANERTGLAVALALREGYLLGFSASGEGYNGAYPFGGNNTEPDKDDAWLANRDAHLQAESPADTLEKLGKLENIASATVEVRGGTATIRYANGVVFHTTNAAPVPINIDASAGKE